MSIADKISINTHYTRSINLERDQDSRGVVEAYIPTSRAVSTLKRVADTFGEHDTTRAWALVGPYGSGKSSFAVYLTHLLGDNQDKTNKLAQKLLKNKDNDLARKFSSEVRNSGGYLAVLLTGSPEPLAKRFVSSLYQAAEEYWGTKRGRTPGIVAELYKLSRKKEPKVSEIVEQVSRLQQQLTKAGVQGILVVFDELGKFLEYEARHYGANDIYLLQALAEHAAAGASTNLYIFVLLHQAFEQYAKGLGESLKNEWAKVQGRFENIPFLESAEQVLRIVATAFEHDFSQKEYSVIRGDTKSAAKVLSKEEALPGTLDDKAAEELFAECYPLHPVSALLLPVLCQKVAQNERTLFSYLGSQETHGFKDSLKQINKVGQWIYPWEIYDYFILNQPAALTDHYTHRRWAEVVTAIERLGDAPVEMVQLLKTIGLLNIVGVQGGFKASPEIINLCLPKNIKVEETAKALADKSVIQFRKFSGEYRVWQGSDFDLEAAIEDERNQLGNFNLAGELNSRKALLPIVARKYTIKYGALRYFQPLFSDADSYQEQKAIAENPRIVFYLSRSQDDATTFKRRVINEYSPLDIVVLCHNGDRLHQAVGEVLGLQRVSVTRQELNSDPIAQREYSDRLETAELDVDELLSSLIDYPAENEWYWNGNKLDVKEKRELQTALSEVLESVYDKSPIIKNELINRDSPSAQANAARNKLLYAMLSKESEPDLGIEKFPPEKAIYRAVLRQTGLHKETEKNEWGFVEPSKRSPLYHVWKRIDKFLDGTEKEARSFADLNSELIAPPYGIKAGILPIIYIAAYIVYQHEIALYEERRYTPYLTEEMVDRFVKRPDLFKVQRFRIAGLNASLFQQYSKVIHGDTKQRTLLELAQPLAKFMGTLPEFTQKTRRELSARAQAVRNAFNLAKSPERLLFEELPKAVDFENLAEDSSEGDLEKFADNLTVTLRELRDAYPQLLDKQKRFIAQAFNFDPKMSVGELRKVIAGHCYGLENYTVDTQGLRAFIMRLTKQKGDDEEWFENLLMFLGHKPSTKWDDTDQDKAEYRLSDFSRRVTDLEKIRLHEKDRASKMVGDFDVYLLRSIKKGGDIIDEVVAVDERSEKHITRVKSSIQNSLKELPDQELMLAALAEVVDDFLHNYRDSQVTENEESKKKPGHKLKKSKGDTT